MLVWKLSLPSPSAVHPHRIFLRSALESCDLEIVTPSRAPIASSVKNRQLVDPLMILSDVRSPTLGIVCEVCDRRDNVRRLGLAGAEAGAHDLEFNERSQETPSSSTGGAILVMKANATRRLTPLFLFPCAGCAREDDRTHHEG